MARKLLLSTNQPLTGHEKQPGATYQLYEDGGINPEIYIDGMQGVVILGPVIKINCFTRGFATPAAAGQVEERDVACRLVMGIDTFFSVVDWLKSVSDDLRPKIEVVVEEKK